MRSFRFASLFLALALLLSACGSLWGNIQQMSGTPTLTPFQPEGFTPPVSATQAVNPAFSTFTSPPASLWLSPAVPQALQSVAQASGIPLTTSPETASARIEVNLSADLASPQTSLWVYALVAPFPTIADGVSLADLRGAWSGAASGAFAGLPLRMDAATLAAFTSLWGAPVGGAVKLEDPASLLDSAWAEQPSWALIPFEALGPRWKVLSVDGLSPLHNDFNAIAYPLSVPFSLTPALFALPPSNRDPGKLTVLAMTGVTALVRATADRMEKHGILYPGEVVREVLRAADLTHISNEVSFDPNCPTPDPWGGTTFCSDPRYIALLEDIGVDIVELTGNHLLDYSAADMLMTLDMYDQRGWRHFGGGRNMTDALAPLTLTDHGNKLAFIGCNYVGPDYDFATDTSPGSAPCDYSMMQSQIASLRSQGYLPIVTFQYSEYYQYNPTDYEREDFRSMADAGAVIVSGSQAHMPAALEFDGNALIHYGLGNLFFDQMSYELDDGTIIYGTRYIFIDRHIFYDNRYLGSELLTYVNEDYSRPRQMTEAERAAFLADIFAASIWQP